MSVNHSIIDRVVSAGAAGLVSVIVGFTSSVALIYQTVINLGGDTSLAASWLLALGLAMGVTSIGLSLFYRLPILIAWSTPGAALLMANTQQFTLNEAVAGFIISALLITISGITGWFEKLINKLPIELASAMLAGILINFGINVFSQVNNQPLLVGAMLATYLLAKRFTPRFFMLIVLLVSGICAWQLELFSIGDSVWQASEFVYIAPHFSLNAAIGIGVPLFIITMAAQNLPGIAVLKAHDYPVPVSSVLTVTGGVNIISAPFGGYAINLAAITAAICMTDEVSKDPKQRYWAAISGGMFYLVMAFCAGYLMLVFSSLPQPLIYALAGIALFGTITQSVKRALSNDNVTEAAMLTLMVTASDISLWGIGSVLWGLMVGIITLVVQRR